MKFRPMRRKHQQLADEDSIQILTHATAGVLALHGDEGYPYGVPISYVYDNGKLYFHSAITGHKIDAIRGNDKASFTVIEKDDVKPKEFTTYFRSVICFGRIRIIEDETEKLVTVRKLSERYNPGDDEGFQYEINKSLNHMLMIEMAIEHITGKEAIEIVRARR